MMYVYIFTVNIIKYPILLSACEIASPGYAFADGFLSLNAHAAPLLSVVSLVNDFMAMPPTNNAIR